MLLCYCTDCQKTTGGASLPQIAVRKSSVEVVGDVTIYSLAADSGYEIEIAFCGKCGTSLYKTSSRFADRMYLIVGGLDDSSWFAPNMKVFEGSRPAWDRL